MRLALILPLLLLTTTSHAIETADAVGTWNVTSTVQFATCPDVVEGEMHANTWTVSARPRQDGPGADIAVSVQGDTHFPKMTGFSSPSVGLVATGASPTGSIRAMTTFELKQSEPGKLTGIRTTTSIFREGGVPYTCFVRSSVVAKR